MEARDVVRRDLGVDAGRGEHATRLLGALPLRTWRPSGRSLLDRELGLHQRPPDRAGWFEELRSPRRHAQSPARCDHAPQLGERGGHVGHEEDREAAQHHVEGTIGKAECAEVAFDELDVLQAFRACFRPRELEGRDRQICADDRTTRPNHARRRERAVSRTTPDVEHPISCGHVAPRDELRSEAREERHRIGVEVLRRRRKRSVPLPHSVLGRLLSHVDYPVPAVRFGGNSLQCSFAHAAVSRP